MACVIFQNYRPHKPLEVCTYCCVCEHNVELIYKLPVRELSTLTIYDYVNAVECGDKIALSDEILYFMPRMFEFLVEDEEIRMEFEDSLSECYLNLGVWSELELTVFKQFAKLFLKNKLCQYDDWHYVNVFGIIEMIFSSGLVEIIDELLEVLLKFLNNDVALINFCEYIYHTNYDSYCDIDCNCDDCQGLYGKISQWINYPHHKHIISQKILALTEKPIYQTLNDEYQYYIETVFDRLSK
ncbi:hypothetical protein [Moraxella equi]|uniref:Uncharacterized protein n=1 Tax=Moraxella equi TaxID=60442 RepID=A0A378QMK1_9GAMM|nr:hypothetical protein [Moraxella equi]OPH33453.1 hypothetical protein B5J93_12870 [Moraxella equi]STZ02075.1 Uncharacterised protein [Moraxella equi]